jgi:hypothetical protein
MTAKKAPKLYHVTKGYGFKSKDGRIVKVGRTKDQSGNVKDPIALSAEALAAGKKFKAVKEA